MSEINYQALREVAERAIPAMERLLMLPADDDLLSEQELKDYGVDIDALNAFKFLTGPEAVLALLDELERNQQYIKRRDQENEDIALTVGRLRVEREAANKRIAELEAREVVPDEMTPKQASRSYCGEVRGYRDGWNACRAAMLQSGNFLENKNSSTNYPVIPSEVLSAILKVAKIRADFDDFDGDRRGIGDCLDEAEQELIVTINKYASQLAAEPIATNEVREQTAVPPVPVIQADVAQAIEKLKRKLVECNRYNYCADAVKGVEYACHAAMLQGSQPVSQTYKFPVNTPCQDAPAHIWLQTAGVWPEDGELSELTWCSHNQHHDDTLYVRADLVNGNSQVTPDGWISCSERMPENIPGSCKEYLVFDGLNNKVHHDYWVVPDGDSAPVASFWNHYGAHVTHWMPLPEPPQEVNRG